MILACFLTVDVWLGPSLHEQLCEGVHVEVGDSLHQLLLQVFLQQAYLDSRQDPQFSAKKNKKQKQKVIVK